MLGFFVSPLLFLSFFLRPNRNCLKKKKKKKISVSTGFLLGETLSDLFPKRQVCPLVPIGQTCRAFWCMGLSPRRLPLAATKILITSSILHLQSIHFIVSALYLLHFTFLTSLPIHVILGIHVACPFGRPR